MQRQSEKYLLEERNQSRIDTKFFHQIFEAIAKEKFQNNLDDVAIIFQDETWTYQKLNEQANQLANYLLVLKEKRNWCDGTCVALLFENSPEAIVSILAVMKAGLSYFPLTPGKRLSNKFLLKYYIEASGPSYFIYQDSLAENNAIQYIKDFNPTLDVMNYNSIILNNYAITNPDLELNPEQLAYIIFSSGETDIPKGIKIAHRGLINPVFAVKEAFEITPQDHIGWHSLLTFDASILDIMTALATGATSVIIPNEIRTDAERLTRYLHQHEVSIITLVPLVLDMLNPERVPAIRGIISTGEAANEKILPKWVDEKRKIINGYGPTEATICTSLGVYVPNEKPIPIGARPVPGMTWFVLSKATSEEPYPANPLKVPDGEEGELYLAGPGLALGYVDTEASYQMRFREIPHPDDITKRIEVYQTGDIVKKRNDLIYYLYRHDDQYKYLGELLHPGSIEIALREYEKDNKRIFSRAKIIMHKDNKNLFPFLQAYLTLSPDQAIEFDENLIRDVYFYLRHNRNCTFIPSRFSLVQDWPVNDNLKTDTKKFEEKGFEEIIVRTLYSGFPFLFTSKTGIEENIRKLWQDVLFISPEKYSISLDDNFYELGGDSLRTNMLLENIGQLYPAYDKDFAQFNAWPTIRNLIFQINQRKNIMSNCVKWLVEQNEVQNNRFPVVLIHAADGDTDSDYRHVIPAWKNNYSDHPLLQIRCPSLDNSGYVTTSLAQLAKDYIKMLEEKLKAYRGPLIFVGYSAGGIIAYEMARQCQKKNRLAAVYCIDTLSPNYYKNLSQAEYASEIYAMMSHIILRDFNLDMSSIISLKELQQYDKDKQLNIYWRKLIEYICKSSDLLENDIEYYLRKFTTLRNVVANQLDYQVQPIDYMTLLSFSETQGKCKNDPCLNWGDRINNENNLHQIEGKHLDLVNNEDWVKNIFVPKLKYYIDDSEKYIRQYNLETLDPIHVAAKEGNLEKLKIFIRDGDGDVLNKKNYINNTPLHYAVLYGRIEVVHWLLRQDGIDVNNENFFSHSVLYDAITSEYSCSQKMEKDLRYQIIVSLLLNGANARLSLDSLNKISQAWLKKAYLEDDRIETIIGIVSDGEMEGSLKKSNRERLYKALQEEPLDEKEFSCAQFEQLKIGSDNYNKVMKLHEEGNYFYEKGNYLTASTRYQKALAINAEYAQNQNAKHIVKNDKTHIAFKNGFCLCYQYRYMEAVESFNMAIDYHGYHGKNVAIIYYAKSIAYSASPHPIDYHSALSCMRMADIKNENQEFDITLLEIVKKFLTQQHDKILHNIIISDASDEETLEYIRNFEKLANSVKHTIEYTGVNTFSSVDNTLLHCAAFKRKLNVLKWLLAKGENVNALNIFGNSPLCDAITSAYINPFSHLNGEYDRALRYRIVLILLLRGADANEVLKHLEKQDLGKDEIQPDWIKRAFNSDKRLERLIRLSAEKTDDKNFQDRLRYAFENGELKDVNYDCDELREFIKNSHKKMDRNFLIPAPYPQKFFSLPIPVKKDHKPLSSITNSY